MPTATPFTALGKGNGFPFCPNELAVQPVNGNLGMTTNAYNDAYATFNGGDFYGLSATLGFSRPFYTLTDAMQTYWNLHSFTISASVAWSKNSNSDSASITDALIQQSVERTPMQRVCYAFRQFNDIPALPGNARVNINISGIFYFDTGSGLEYYWSIYQTGINPGIGVGSIYPSTFEMKEDFFEYSPLVLNITDTLVIDMAYYTTSELDSGTASASVETTTYYTYPQT